MYKVENAIIMAAGLSSRFLPLSLEKPKSLWQVNGEVLIERQIKQLIETGIKDITVVVGYMADKFEYLVDAFGVEIVLNEDYYRYNNLSSLVPVLDKINNTYICSSDNYFVKNPFKAYMKKSEYPIVYNPNELGEYYVSLNNEDKIVEVEIGQGDYCLIGQVFFDEEFSKVFKEIIVKSYPKEDVKVNLWEHLYIQHLDKLAMHAKIVDASEMLEFDSLEELQVFDKSYLDFNGSDVLNIITEVLKCQLSEIKNIKVLEGGLTNSIFTFTVGEEKFVFRHPGIGTSEYINRVSESHAHQIAHDQDFDPALIWISDEGDKISRFVEDFRYFEYENLSDVKIVLKTMRDLHDLNLEVGYIFDIEKEIESFWSKISAFGQEKFKDILTLREKVLTLLSELDYQNTKKTLCHNDIYPTNFLMTKERNYLIDWEFASDTHPALDLGTFVVCSPYDSLEIKNIVKIYLGEDYSLEKEIEYYKYFTVSGFYWLMWALFQESNGQSTDGFLDKYYNYVKMFLLEIEEKN